MRLPVSWNRVRFETLRLLGRRRASPPTGRIFLCYRWEDSEGSVGHLQDRLEEHYGETAVFRDIKIRPGEDYREAIRRELATCYAVLVVIGRRWLTAVDDEGRRRIDYQRDALRMEVEFALEHDPRIRVIPVLVEGAQMPRPRDLPASIHRLAYRVAHELTSARFRDDLRRLVERLEHPREDRFAAWSDIRPPRFPAAPLIANALLRPYRTNLLVPLGLVVAGFLWSSWLWVGAAALYVALVATTLFDLQQARYVRAYGADDQGAPAQPSA